MKKKVLVPLLIGAALVVTLPMTIGKKETNFITAPQAQTKTYRLKLEEHRIYRASSLEGHDVLVHEFPGMNPVHRTEFEYYVDTTGDGYANVRGTGEGDFKEENIIKTHHVGYKNFELDSVETDMRSRDYGKEKK